MRIVGGKWGGHRLKAPKGNETRPTLDPHKETLFNVLEHGLARDWKGVLDLFAGSGALGFEALSRGAEFVIFVESNNQALQAIRENGHALKLTEGKEFFLLEEKNLSKWKSAIGKLKKDFALNENFSHVFCDPPYSKNLGMKAFEALNAPKEGVIFLGKGTLWIQESGVEDPQIDLKKYSNWVQKKTKEMGGTRVDFFQFTQG